MFKKNKVHKYAPEFVQWGADKQGPLYPLFHIMFWKEFHYITVFSTHPHTFVTFYFYKECDRIPLEVEW